MSYSIADLDGIGSDAAGVLKKIGIRTSARLLREAKTPQGRKQLASKTGLDEKQILAFVNLVDRMRIKGVGEEYAELLHAAGVNTVKELKYRNPANLAKALAAANASRKLVRLLPSEKAVERWIDTAKRLSIEISY